MPHRLHASAVALALALAIRTLGAQTSQSIHLAGELDSLLTMRGLDAIAAPDPQAPDRFVAALAFPKSQLLVVDAAYPAPILLKQEIADKKYRDVYQALQQAGLPDTRLFFLDLGYDGLRGSADAVDVLYEGATKQMIFDGQPEKHKLTKSAYEKAFASAETTYSRLLGVLISRLKEPAAQ
jgi:hypothetical protein